MIDKWTRLEWYLLNPQPLPPKQWRLRFYRYGL
jgi:hypothetical protein